MIRDGAIIARKTSFSWKRLVTIPFVFVIQIFTGSFCKRHLFKRGKYDHVAVFFHGKVLEYLFSTNGLYEVGIQEWSSKNVKKGVKFFYYNLTPALTAEQKELSDKFLEEERKAKREFSVKEAAISAIDNSIVNYDNPNVSFCSGFAERYLDYINVLSLRDDSTKSDPNELIRRLVNSNLVQTKRRML